MSLARRCAAARNNRVAKKAVTTIALAEIALVALAALAIRATPALGEDGPQLVLPLGRAVALLADEPAETVPCQTGAVATTRATGRGSGRQLGLLPSQIRLPDLYSEEIDVNIPRYAEPVDNDRIVSFEIFRRRQRGWMASFVYDEEARGPLPGSSVVLGVVAEYSF